MSTVNLSGKITLTAGKSSRIQAPTNPKIDPDFNLTFGEAIESGGAGDKATSYSIKATDVTHKCENGGKGVSLCEIKVSTLRTTK